MSKINQVDLTLEETSLGSFVNVFIIDYLFLFIFGNVKYFKPLHSLTYTKV